jgi:hypothetical protein
MAASAYPILLPMDDQTGIMLKVAFQLPISFSVRSEMALSQPL